MCPQLQVLPSHQPTHVLCHIADNHVGFPGVPRQCLCRSLTVFMPHGNICIAYSASEIASMPRLYFDTQGLCGVTCCIVCIQCSRLARSSIAPVRWTEFGFCRSSQVEYGLAQGVLMVHSLVVVHRWNVAWHSVCCLCTFQ